MSINKSRSVHITGKVEVVPRAIVCDLRPCQCSVLACFCSLSCSSQHHHGSNSLWLGFDNVMLDSCFFCARSLTPYSTFLATIHPSIPASLFPPRTFACLRDDLWCHFRCLCFDFFPLSGCTEKLRAIELMAFTTSVSNASSPKTPDVLSSAGCLFF